MSITHRFQSEEGRPTVVLINGDFSGDAEFSVMGRDIEEISTEHTPEPPDKVYAVKIPYADLRSLVLQELRGRVVDRLENADDEELLQMLTGL